MTRTSLLASYLRDAERRRFRYGRWDCVQFAGGWVKIAAGVDPIDGIKYRSLDEGRAILSGQNLKDAVSAQFSEVPRLWSVPGDLAMVDGALGIVTGIEIACVARRGLQYVPLDHAETCWRVN
jgi:hypothetical protein